MTAFCRNAISFLAEYLEDALPAEQRATFERHLRRCPYCRDYLKTYQDTVRLSQAVADPTLDPTIEEPPKELVEAILDSLSSSKTRNDAG
jgi:anti-sigma factor RsiW